MCDLGHRLQRDRDAAGERPQKSGGSPHLQGPDSPRRRPPERSDQRWDGGAARRGRRRPQTALSRGVRRRERGRAAATVSRRVE
eukprot:XP_001708959.1 Hypothetical protein GL50803_32046 [Giardia lamblia ATCC 50803]